MPNKRLLSLSSQDVERILKKNSFYFESSKRKSPAVCKLCKREEKKSNEEFCSKNFKEHDSTVWA